MTPMPHRFAGLIALVGASALIALTQPAMAQFTIQSSLGVQALWFNGDYPARQDISPGNDRTLPLGGGIQGNNPGFRLQLELIPDPNSIFRIPVSLEGFVLDGRTTFSASTPNDTRTKRWLFTNSASMFSAGVGITASFFKLPSLYFSAEGRVNYMPATSLTSRIYYVDNNEDVAVKTIHPDPIGQTRIGAYFRMGTQAGFFRPFLLDFNVGYGIINLAGKVTDPDKQRNLFVVDTQLHPAEITLGYIGFGMSLVWSGQSRPSQPEPQEPEVK